MGLGRHEHGAAAAEHVLDQLQRAIKFFAVGSAAIKGIQKSPFNVIHDRTVAPYSLWKSSNDT